MAEAEAAERVVLSGMLAQGREVEAFENDLCDYLGYDAGHAVAVSSGSAALYMAIRALNLESGANVAIPTYSCSALKNAVDLADAIPQYVDVSIESPNIDLLDKKISKTNCVIAAQMYGMPQKITDKKVIEDCAQSIGATIDGDKVGTQTDISVFSFYATKPITSGGEGGMVVSKNKSVIEYIKDLRDFDMKNDDKVRFNFQMTDLQAAIGRVQLGRLDSFVERRRYLADRYEAKGISLWHRVCGGIDYRALIVSNNQHKLIDYFSSNHIGAIIPIEENELLSCKEEAPNAYELTQKLVSIPLYPSLSEEEQDIIIKTLIDYKNLEGHL